MKNQNIEKDNIFLRWKKKSLDYRVMSVLNYLLATEQDLESYESFLDAVEEITFWTLDRYLFDNYWEQFIYHFYLLYLGHEDYKFYRAKQNLQAAEKAWERDGKETENAWEEDWTTQNQKSKTSWGNEEGFRSKIWKGTWEISKETKDIPWKTPKKNKMKETFKKIRKRFFKTS